MSSPQGCQQVKIIEPMDVVVARGAARTMARLAGYGAADQTRLATAVSELARNILHHAGQGVCAITDASSEAARLIRIVFEDHGPGIPDIERAMQDGYSTNGSLGAGLPGTKRLMDEFAIESQPGLTRVTIALIRSRK
jgi:serine/threonine-protein kinase RsbT